MQSSSTHKLSTLVLAAILAGCSATAAPDLPRYTGSTSDEGFRRQSDVGTLSTSASASASASASKVALLQEQIWAQLSADEQELIRNSHEVKLLGPNAYGLILDVQGQDQSTPGTTGGAALGGAVASAAYLDHAFRGNNSYSAGAGLALGLLGAAIGSTMDAPAVKQFQFRYTIQQGDGEIGYFDEIKSSGFRHSVGVCVLTPSLTLVSQHVCKQTVETARSRYVRTSSASSSSGGMVATPASEQAK